MAKKMYAVKMGRAPGVYATWDECKLQVNNFPGADFKSFPTREEAEKYLTNHAEKVIPEQPACRGTEMYDIYVDGSFSPQRNRYSWAFVVYNQQEVIFSDCAVGEHEEAVKMRNVAGELAATMRAVKWAVESNKKPVVIHHDYAGISAWAVGSWKTNNKFTQAYARFISPHLSWITFHKVQGHSGVAGNEMADKLAKAAFVD